MANVVKISPFLGIFGQKCDFWVFPDSAFSGCRAREFSPNTPKFRVFWVLSDLNDLQNRFGGWRPIFKPISKKKGGGPIFVTKYCPFWPFLSTYVFFTPIYIYILALEESWAAKMYGFCDTWIYPPPFFFRRFRVIAIFLFISNI